MEPATVGTTTWIQSFVSSSPPPRSRSTPQTSTNFAFLVHSQDSISTNTGPNIDNKPLVRQRRRRTSPEDHIILEYEFKRNEKPDRDARRRIVERVSLGDKEVHIWFQNRRQKTRRKGDSLPDDRLLTSYNDSLDSSSLADLSTSDSFDPHSSPTALQPLPTTSTSFVSDIAPAEADSQAPHILQDRKPIDSSEVTPDPKNDPKRSPEDEPVVQVGADEPSTIAKASPGNADIPAQESVPEEAAAISQGSISNVPHKHDPAAVGAPSVTTDVSRISAPLEPAQPSAKAIVATSLVPTDIAASRVRLSFTSTGSARLLAESESTPSPPKAHPMAPTPFATRQSLRRSYSAAGLSDFKSRVGSLNSTPALPSSSQPTPRLQEPLKTAPLLQRQSTGRSQDSRTWEFWCNSSARTESAKDAEKQMEGNARHAIGLLRSRSQHGSRPAARPVRQLSRASSCREPVTGHADKRIKVDANDTRTSMQAKPKHKLTGLGIFEDGTSTDRSPERTLRSPVGDSDKENHGPRRQHQPSKSKPQRRRPVLAESHTAPRLGRARTALGDIAGNGRNGSKTLSSKLGKTGRSDGDPENDEEIAKFMNGGAGSGRSERGGDEDELAVQGLLSLSQGNWR